jgi:hypothetical protein
MSIKTFVWLLSITFAMSGFAGSLDLKTYKYSFSKKDKFTVNFADYPKGEEAFFQLTYKNGAALPPNIYAHKPGLKISGNNHSDDLFMYAYKKIKHLKPNTTYQADFSIELASNAPKGSVGAGGSPGDSVYVKIGVVSKKPERYVDDGNYYRMSLDKGNQKSDGQDMITMGTVGVDTEQNRYRLKTLFQEDPWTVSTNPKGEAWVILGTDSGFEGTTTIFYTNLVVNFKEISIQ